VRLEVLENLLLWMIILLLWIGEIGSLEDNNY